YETCARRSLKGTGVQNQLLAYSGQSLTGTKVHGGGQGGNQHQADVRLSSTASSFTLNPHAAAYLLRVLQLGFPLPCSSLEMLLLLVPSLLATSSWVRPAEVLMVTS